MSLSLKECKLNIVGHDGSLGSISVVKPGCNESTCEFFSSRKAVEVVQVSHLFFCCFFFK